MTTPQISVTYFFLHFYKNGYNSLIGSKPDECQSQSQLSTKNGAKCCTCLLHWVCSYIRSFPPWKKKFKIHLSYHVIQLLLRSDKEVSLHSISLWVSLTPRDLGATFLNPCLSRCFMGINNPVNRDKWQQRKGQMKKYEAEIWKKIGSQSCRNMQLGDLQVAKMTKKSLL